MPSRIVPAQTSRSGPVRASVALRGLAGAAHACGNILQNPLQHSLKLRHSHRAVAAGLLWPGKIRYFASQNRARSTRRPSSSTGSARLQTCSVERDASRRRGRHNKNSDNGRERPQSQRLERLRPEPAPPPVRTVAKTHKTATDASLTEKLEISARLSQLLNEDVFVATELEKEPDVQQRRGSRSSMEKFRQKTMEALHNQGSLSLEQRTLRFRNLGLRNYVKSLMSAVIAKTRRVEWRSGGRMKRMRCRNATSSR